jgi:F-type H+-transporting ATPase subunit epsilon
MSFQVRLIAPEGVVVKEQAVSVKVPTAMGDIGVMSNHVDYVGLLDVGVATIELEDGTKKDYVVRDGLCRIESGNCDLITDRVVFASEKNNRNLASEIETLKKTLDTTSLFDPAWDVKRSDLKELQALNSL